MEKTKYFNCPSCGNPLKESSKPKIKCQYCDTIIVPRNSKIKREEEIYVKNFNK